MAIADDWHVDFIAKVISHVDGVLDYDSGAGTQPAVGDVIRGATSGAVGKVLARSGNAAIGTLTLTSVTGRFQDNESLVRCDRVNIKDCPNTGGGIKVGDTVTGATSGRTGVVRFIEFNLGSTAGSGTIWSEDFGSGTWTNNENINVSGTVRALADGTGSDLNGTWTGALVNEPTNGTISPPISDADSYAIANQDATQALGNGTVTGVGQSFSGNNGRLDSVQFYLSKTASPTGNATARIYAHSGTFGTSSVPTGTALASSGTFDVSTLTGSLSLITFTFTGTNRISLISGTRYVVTIEYSGGNATNYVNVGTDASSPTHPGNLSTQAGSWSADSARDAIFFVKTVMSSSLIINFDGGTKAFSRFCKIQNTNNHSPTKTGFVQRVYGVTATGSLRLVDTTGTWADNDPIYVVKVPYDNLQTGQKFKVGDKIVTKATPGGADVITGKIIEVETLTATTGILTLQNQTGLVTDNHRIEVRTTSDTYVADVNAPAAADQYVLHADVNGGEIKTQLATQGGIYSSNDGLNVVRDCNELYTLLQDTFDELSALDDEIPMTAQVALQQYTLVNNWKIPDPSFRFLESGSIQDSGLDNIWTNYQTLGSVEGIGDTVYAATTPLPQLYIEQGGSLVDPWWKEGHIDVLVKVKTNTNSTLVSSTARGDGVLINSGTVTIFNRNYTDTYDHFTTTTIAGVAPVPLATSNDLDNQTGTHNFTYSVGGGTFLLGEEIVANNDVTKRGIITKINTGPTSLDYELTGSTQFANTDAFTGQRSGATGTVNAAPTNLVAGYGTKIIIATVDLTIPHGTITGTFIPGEQISQAGSGAQGVFMATVGGTMTIGNHEGPAFNASGVITGATSGATTTPTAGPTVATTIQRDVAHAKTTGDGSGNAPYNAVIFLRRNALTGEGETLARMYEWIKYRTRRLETGGEPPSSTYNKIGGKGSETGRAGRFYISLDSSYAPVKASPLGTFAGGKFFGARGVFVQQMHSNDIRSFQLIDANGVVRNPPNKQTLKVDGVVAGDRVAVFRRVNSTPGSGIMVNEYTVGTVGGPNNGAGDTQILVAAGARGVSPLEDDIPDSGVIRVRNASTQLYESFSYTSVSRSTNIFTLASPLAADLTAGENVFVPLIETEATGTSVSQDIIHTGTDIPLLTRVRKRGILPFQAEGTFGSSGATISAIRTADTIVD